jgi:topoisomerase IV subunit A
VSQDQDLFSQLPPPPEPPEPPGADDPDSISLGRYAERAYLDYAVSVVKGRALPTVSDGQKPVQRRIIFEMNEMGLGAAAKPRKSAAVVGNVLGKLHPHGDQSVYDALVRMAQDFSLRYPLIDGQGNFGSRDGDNAAAMRYTEARLTPIARLLLDEIDMGTVEFINNYDGTATEPNQLPARLPMVLLNGASGIAVGLATEIPSHNLREVAKAAIALIRNRPISTRELLEHIQGPDFPGGGQIISPREDILEAYETGRGSIKVRARYTIEELARGQWQLVVHELPPGASPAKVLQEIEELTNPKVRAGKKALTPEQQNQKQLMLSLLDRATDQSDKDNAVRLVFEPRTSKVDQQEFINTLLAHTGMEQSVSFNLVMVGIDGRPRQKNLPQILGEWVDFRFETVKRRTQFRLEKVRERIHILDGRMIAFLNIEKVIKVIREAEDPKRGLIEKFKLSERQAEDILEIRLRQLARLEGIKIEQEIKDLRAEQSQLQELLDNASSMRKLIIKEIEADAKLYGDDRRTLIQQAERASVEQKVVDEPVTVIFSEKGWVRARTGHGHDANLFTFKEGDALYGTFECRTVDNAVLMGSNGRVYTVPVAQLPGARGDGVPVTTLIDLEAGSKLAHMLAGAADVQVLLASSAGYGFVCKLGDMQSRLKAGKAFIKLEEKAEPLRPAVVESAHTKLAALSAKGRLLVFDLAEINTLAGGGRGVIVQELEPKETLLGACSFGPHGVVVEGEGRGGKEFNVTLSPREASAYAAKRARKGKALTFKIKPAGVSAAIAKIAG